jgi:hypothetical protein
MLKKSAILLDFLLTVFYIYASEGISKCVPRFCEFWITALRLRVVIFCPPEHKTPPSFTNNLNVLKMAYYNTINHYVAVLEWLCLLPGWFIMAGKPSQQQLERLRVYVGRLAIAHPRLPIGIERLPTTE